MKPARSILAGGVHDPALYERARARAMAQIALEREEARSVHIPSAPLTSAEPVLWVPMLADAARKAVRK